MIQVILTLFPKGMSYAAIAEARGIKTATVRNAIYVIRDRQGGTATSNW